MLNIAVEEVAKACASGALILMIQELGSLPIKLAGTDEQKERVLPKLASGEWSPAFALSEPDSGSDRAGCGRRPSATATMGDQRGKNWITNGGVADIYICFAVTDLDRTIARDLGLRGRPTAGLLRRQAGEEDGHPGLPPPSRSSMTSHPGRAPDRRPRTRASRSRCRRSTARARGRRAGRRASPRARPTTPPLRQGAPAVRQADRRVSRGSSRCSPTWVAHGCGPRLLIAPARRATRRRHHGKALGMAKLFATDVAMEVRLTPCSCSAATATSANTRWSE